jgi:uncharacterized membrane protein YfcA
MDALQTLAAIGCGGIVGFTLGLVGGGGSILAVPLLLYVVGMRTRRSGPVRWPWR